MASDANRLTRDSPMPEIWLRTNARALRLGMILPGALAALGAALAGGLFGEQAWVRGTGIALAAIGGILILSLWRATGIPRLAYRDGLLLVHLRSGPPIELPIELVEGFLLGQGPANLPGRRMDRAEARQLVVRVAERASEWANVEVKPALGRWCGGYVTIHGAWCEPLDVALVSRLNRRLAELQRERQAAAPSEVRP
jgi:hypothetical protein